TPSHLTTAKASADVAMTAPRPTATTTSWVQKPRISPKVAKQPRAKPWLSEALITAMAPGPGEKLIAHAAMKKASQSDGDIGAILPAAPAATMGDGQGEIDLQLHRMRRDEPEVARQVPGLRRLEHARRVGRRKRRQAALCARSRPAARRSGGDARRDRRH